MGWRQYLFEHVYLNPVAKGEEAKVMHMITNLYHIYMEKPELMPEQLFEYAGKWRRVKRTDSV